MKIGLFDSGIGGLTLLEEALRQRPGSDYHFYADTDHVPYGLRSSEDILQFTDEAVDFLLNKGCECIVIACNTATAVAAETIRAKYTLPIVGIEPAVKSAMEHHADKRVLVVATPVTIRGDRLHRLIDRFEDRDAVDLCPLPELVDMAERADYAALPYLQNVLKDFEPELYSEIVLGCTHFNYFKDSFRRLFPKAEIVDGAEGTIRRMCSLLPSETCEESSVTFYRSGREITDEASLSALWQRMHRLRHMRAL